MWSPDCNHKFYGSAKLDCQHSVKPLRKMDELKLLDAFSTASMSLKCYDRHPNLKTEIICECQRTTPFSNIHKALNPFKAPRAENISQHQRFSHCEFGETGLKKVEILSCVVVFLNQGFCFH